MAYLCDRAEIAAVADGDERWRVTYDELGGSGGVGYPVPSLAGVGSDRVFVTIADRLHALGTSNGEEQWMIETPAQPAIAIADSVAYAVGRMGHPEELRALETRDGTTLWRQEIEYDGRYQFIRIVDDHLGDAHSIFVNDRKTIARYDPEGEKTWEWSTGTDIYRYVLDEFVYVGTEDGTYAVNPR